MRAAPAAGPAGAVLPCVEWAVFTATHSRGGAAWKSSGCFAAAPPFVRAVMANNFRTALGSLAIGGACGARCQHAGLGSPDYLSSRCRAQSVASVDLAVVAGPCCSWRYAFQPAALGLASTGRSFGRRANALFGRGALDHAVTLGRSCSRNTELVMGGRQRRGGGGECMRAA